jgi:putative protein-disulfide isomerase
MSDRQDIQKHLLYVADPMCSWCYGFSPVIAAIAGQYAHALPLRVVMGGLKPGETRRSRDKDMDYLRQAWAHVGTLSGQSFNSAFFERDGFVYDTEPASRAVVAIRHVFPNDALAFLARLSTSFYAANRDITDSDVIADIAGEAGYSRDEFLKAFQSQAARDETQRDFAMCKQAGIRGFPTLLACAPGQGYQIITQGFCALADIEGALDAWTAA